MWRSCALALCTVFLWSFAASSGLAQEAPAAAPMEPAAAAAPEATPPADPLATLTSNSSALRIGMDTMWVLVAGMLVFWMNAGFALVESGLCRAKNCLNILAKNFIVFAASALSFWVIGRGLMFGDEDPYYGQQGLFFVSGRQLSALGEAYMTAMNPFSTVKYKGSMERSTGRRSRSGPSSSSRPCSPGPPPRLCRVRWPSRSSSWHSWSSASSVAFVYPISGHWIWGSGFLGANNFRDFAGCTVVHSVGELGGTGRGSWSSGPASESTRRTARSFRFPVTA